MKPASAPAAVAAVGDEGIEPLGNHRKVLCRLFYRQTCGTSPKSSSTGAIRTHSIGPSQGPWSADCLPCCDSAGPIRTDKREGLSLAAFPISVTAPQVAGEWRRSNPRCLIFSQVLYRQSYQPEIRDICRRKRPGVALTPGLVAVRVIGRVS